MAINYNDKEFFEKSPDYDRSLHGPKDRYLNEHAMNNDDSLDLLEGGESLKPRQRPTRNLQEDPEIKKEAKLRFRL